MRPRRIEPPRSDLHTLGGNTHLVVLAREVADGDGHYDDSVITLVKELKVAGADAGFEHESAHRRWIGEKAFEPTALDLIVGVGSNAVWAALCAVVKHRKSDRVRVRWGRHNDADDELEWFEAEGSGEAVASAIEATCSADEQESDEPEAQGA